jgi:tRNA(Ile)-lysidine synthase
MDGAFAMLIARVRATIVDRGLIPPGSSVLCACSGGPDSAVLLHALARLAPSLGFELAAASVDHGLRPEAQHDVAIAARQAAALSAPFHSLQVTVAPEGSLQANARRARYAALAELATRLGATRIAVGHTQDDQAETVLSRMLRGAGVRGLGAIDPARPDGIIRPLIDCSREQVQQFAREHCPEVAWDQSNFDQRFERVRIRTHLLPALAVEDRAVVRHLAALADDARACARLIDTLAIALLENARLDSETLRISTLLQQTSVLRRAALRLWLLRALGTPPGRAELIQLDRTLSSGRGEVWVSAGHRVRAEQDELRLCPRAADDG